MVRTVTILSVMTAASPALAFDPFGWFGEPAVQPRPDALPYALTVAGAEAVPALATAARDASILQELRDEPPRDGRELAGRVEADLPRITDALWASGRYAAAVTITVGEAASTIASPNTAGLAAAAERRRGRAAVPVTILITPGPTYRLGQPVVVDAATGQPFPADVVPHRTIGLQAGDTASTAAVMAAAARLSDRFRERGHPFVKVARRPPVIDHRDRTVDLVLTVAPGPVATLGPVAVTGTREVDPAVIRSFIYTQPGDPYSPQAIAGIRRSVSRIEALGGVRVREGTALDAGGQLPLTVEVTERPPRLIGGAARYSTTDGPALRAYWAHRNLFGGAERLRLDADLFYTFLDRDGKGRNRRFEAKDIGGRLSASFIKPALGGSRFDLLADVALQRERTESYDADTGVATLAIRRRFTDTFSVQGGIEGESGRITPAPAIGAAPVRAPRFDYGLLGLPLSVMYDNTDRPLDPTRGFRVSASVAPYLGFGDAARTFAIGRLQASTYYALDADARYVIAARLGFGSIVGGERGEIPPRGCSSPAAVGRCAASNSGALARVTPRGG